MLNYATVCYTVFLALGHSLRCQSLKNDTIKLYLYNSATFIMQFNSFDRDACKKLGETKLCPAVNAVVGIVKQYKDMKDHQEPFTNFILQDSYKYALSN